MTHDFLKPSDLVAWSLEKDLGTEADNEVLRAYYSAFHRSFGPLRRYKYDVQLEQLTELVRSGAVKRVLDVGCGCGSVSLWLALQGADVTGIDITDERLRVARRRAQILGLSPSFRGENLLDLSGQYDAIWIEQAYHHLEPRAEIQARISDLLAPRGHLIISESNAWNPLVQVQMLKARGFKTIGDHIDDQGRRHVYGIERITTPGALSRDFGRHGVETTDTRYFGVLPNNGAAETLAFIEKMIPSVLVPAFSHYLWVGRKRDGPVWGSSG